MSEVLKFFEDHFNPSDEFHQMLASRSTMKARLPKITLEALGTCGAQLGKSGKVELVVVDRETFTKMEEERQAIERRLIALDELVVTLDAIFADATASGFDIYQKTPGAILREENQWRAQHRKEPSDPSDPNSRSVGIPNETLTALLKRCDMAMEQAQAAFQ
jgi:hypothetical protein